mmetsp:Transcript_11447/g.46141  ORF Transcript_11447/g.46141 Transcript_11447/m.46141 type:complete len:616 (+) Transcript_11447:1465-3312(+)
MNPRSESRRTIDDDGSKDVLNLTLKISISRKRVSRVPSVQARRVPRADFLHLHVINSRLLGAHAAVNLERLLDVSLRAPRPLELFHGDVEQRPPLLPEPGAHLRLLEQGVSPHDLNLRSHARLLRLLLLALLLGLLLGLLLLGRFGLGGILRQNREHGVKVGARPGKLSLRLVAIRVSLRLVAGAAEAGGGAEQTRALVAPLRERDGGVVKVGLDDQSRLVPRLGLVQTVDHLVAIVGGGDGGAGRAALLEWGIAAAVHGLARGAHVHVTPVEEGERGRLLEFLGRVVEDAVGGFEGNIRLERVVALVQTLGVKIEVRLRVDAEVLAEERGEIEDPLVNLDNLVGRELLPAGASSLGTLGTRRRIVLARGRVQPGELGDDEPHRVEASVDVRRGFALVIAPLRGGDGGGEIVPAGDGLEGAVGCRVPDGERGRVRELLLQRAHQVLVRDHRRHDERANVRARHGFHRHRRSPRALLRLATSLSLAPLLEDERRLLLAELLLGGFGFGLLGARLLLGRLVEGHAAESFDRLLGLEGFQQSLGGVVGSVRRVRRGGVSLGLLLLPRREVRPRAGDERVDVLRGDLERAGGVGDDVGPVAQREVTLRFRREQIRRDRV